MSDALQFEQWLERVNEDIEFQDELNSVSNYWKRYFHFDARLKVDDLSKWQKRLLDPDYIRQYAFYPFLRHEVIKKRFGKVSVQSASGERHEVRVKLKKKPTRPICYAAHQDSLIYAWYGFKLHQLLEAQIIEAGINECVIAYRSLNQKCNIHFANEAFSFVQAQQSCVALAFDVKSFFDTLDHDIVKQSWCRLLNDVRLPKDHFTVYKSMTKFNFVRLESLKKELGEEEFELRRKSGRLSYPSDFRQRVVPLIETNLKEGIPQGAPLSAVLSNLYMFEADKVLSGFAALYGGYYRRYCDDLLLIVPIVDEPEAHQVMLETMKALNLRINKDKTEIRYFNSNANSFDCVDEYGKKAALQYLGLEFDGCEVRLRSASLARYHHRLRRNVRQAARMAFGRRAHLDGKLAPKNGKILKRTLYEKYSLLGNRNFVTYARKAFKITGSQAIKKQCDRSVALVNQCVIAETARRKTKAEAKQTG